MEIRMEKRTKIIINTFINETLFYYIMSCFQSFYFNKNSLENQ